jgi:hypothetical protein
VVSSVGHCGCTGCTRPQTSRRPCGAERSTTNEECLTLVQQCLVYTAEFQAHKTILIFHGASFLSSRFFSPGIEGIGVEGIGVRPELYTLWLAGNRESW